MSIERKLSSIHIENEASVLSFLCIEDAVVSLIMRSVRKQKMVTQSFNYKTSY
jgi:hypothetical protein